MSTSNVTPNFNEDRCFLAEFGTAGKFHDELIEIISEEDPVVARQLAIESKPNWLDCEVREIAPSEAALYLERRKIALEAQGFSATKLLVGKSGVEVLAYYK